MQTHIWTKFQSSGNRVQGIASIWTCTQQDLLFPARQTRSPRQISFLCHFCTQLLSNLLLLPVSGWENAYWLLEEEPMLKSSELRASSPSAGASSWLWVSSPFGASSVTMSESSLIVPTQEPSSCTFSFLP